MDKKGYAKHFSELVVWKKSRELANELFEASKLFPEEEKYSLTNQIRRSSRSVGAQIAEAWAKRRYEKHFVSKLTGADGEQNETQYWLIVALDAGYLERVSRLQLRNPLQGDRRDDWKNDLHCRPILRRSRTYPAHQSPRMRRHHGILHSPI